MYVEELTEVCKKVKRCTRRGRIKTIKYEDDLVKSVILYGCEPGQSKRKKKSTWVVLNYSCGEECLKWNGLLGLEMKYC